MKNFALDSLIVTIANTTVHVANYVVVAGIAAFFGATWQTDAFFLALTFPTFFVSAIVSAVGSVFIPIFTECKITRPQVMGQLIGSALLFALAGTLVIVLIIGAGAVLISRWMPPESATLEFRHLVVQQTLLLLPVIVIQTLTGILSAFYNANERFLIPPATDAVSTFSVLVVIAVSRPTIGIFSVPFGFLIGALLHLIFLSMFWKRFSIRILWTWKMDPALRRSLGLSLPLILGTAALQFGTIITRFLAAQLPEGSVTILDYASRISYGVMELLTSGVLLVILSRWSQKFAENDKEQLRWEAQQFILMVLFIVVPVVAIVISLRQSLVAFAFQRGNFTSGMTLATASVLVFYLLGIPVDAVGRIYVRLFLIWKNTWVIGILAGIRVIFTAITAYFLMRVMEMGGIAFADTLAIILITAIFIVLAYRKIGNTVAGSMGSLFTIGVSAISAGLAARCVADLLLGREILVLVLAGSAGCMIYLVTSWLFRSEQLGSIVTILRPVENWRTPKKLN